MNFVRYLCLLILGAACFAQTTMPTTVNQTTGMVGITAGETAQLNLLNPDTAQACVVTVSFFNASGAMLKTSAANVPPGMSLAVDLASTNLGLSGSARLQIRAVILFPGTPGPAPTSAPVPACTLVPTLEIFDNASGRTLVVVGRVEAVP